jgi:uncharacterized RmlC-like cupin family protein
VSDQVANSIASRISTRVRSSRASARGAFLAAGPGALVTKPRGVPHAFYNAGDEPSACSS